MQGRIIKWDDEKGFGFIQSPEVTENIFVHASSFVDKRIRPAVGDDIAFELKRTDKGLQAKRSIILINLNNSFLRHVAPLDNLTSDHQIHR